MVGYVRVSTLAQEAEGVSLDAQRERLQAYALAVGVELVEVFEDAGWSAKSLRRPGLQQALAALDAGRACGLLVCKLDRLTRNVADLGHLLAQYFTTSFDLLSVGDAIDTRTAAGRLTLNVLASVSAWEREACGERTSEALQHLKRRGVRLGGAELGWYRTEDRDVEGRLTFAPNEEELATIQRIRVLRGQSLSLRQICATLTSEGRKTKRGAPWSPKVVRSILLRGASRDEDPAAESPATRRSTT